MRSRIPLLRSIALLAGLVAFAGCDRSSNPESPLAPQFVSGSNSGSGYGYSYSKNYSVKLVNEPMLSTGDLQVSKLIGLNGGSISLLGHTLTVPAGAVTVPTLFTMANLPLTPSIDVEVTATVTDLVGRVIDVGSFGFDKEVTLTLSYSRATNLSGSSRLWICYVGPDGLIELNSSVNTKSKTVSTRLNHFSKYAMASD